MLWPALQGFGATIALIAAIGAQNAFLLGQGVRKRYQWTTAFVCMSADWTLVTVGVLGAGVVFNSFPNFAQYAGWGGAIFLVIYGSLALQRFLKPQALEYQASLASYKKVIVMALAVSWLNPHAYLDTVVLLGSIGSQFSGADRLIFWLGALLASSSWFIALTWLASKLAPFLGQPKRWRWVELIVALSMWGIAGWLLLAR